MACLSVDTNKHLLHALFAIQRRGPNRKKKKIDLSDLLSELKKKVWKESGSEEGLKEGEGYAEEGERKDEQFRGKQLNGGSWRG